ncbi:MAG: murein biosynthesis integral membrane protein MurJ [Chloroflexota bacterium]|nr:murein biosynthesis integral membrane protein MurJ [Chloroflexota bacterium]MDE2931468.1 murein biosynthesis integral membrane protein MurJ [Chloroflexota bacterium]
MSDSDSANSSGRFAWLRTGRSTVAGGATILMVSYVLSRVLGLGREVAISARFGTSDELAAYVAAFRLPDLAFLLFAGGALSSAYIPLYREALARDDPVATRAFTSSVLNAVIIALAFFVAVIILLAPWLVPLIAPGFDSEGQRLTVMLLGIVAFSPLLLAASEVLTATLHARQHFLLPSFSPLLYNLAIVIGAIVLALWWGILGVAAGVVIGAALHFLVQIPAFRALGPGYRPLLNVELPALKRLIQLTVPRMAGLVVVHLSLIFIMVTMASTLGKEMVAAMNYAWIVMMLPLGVFGMSVARAWFPQFAAAAVDGPTPELAGQLTTAIRTVLFFLLPAAAGLMLFAPLVVAALFERGEFDATSTELTAWALLFFGLGLAGHGAVEVLNRGFFALKDTRTPVLIAIVSMGLGIVLAYLLMRPLAQGGLALGISLAVLLEAVWLWVLLARRVPDFRFLGGMPSLILCTLLAAGVGGALQWLIPLTESPAIVRLVLYGVVLLGVYVVAALLLGVPEARTVWQRMPLIGRRLNTD